MVTSGSAANGVSAAATDWISDHGSRHPGAVSAVTRVWVVHSGTFSGRGEEDSSERARQGWCALDLQAERDCEAPQAALKPTWTYSRRGPEGTTRTRTTQIIEYEPGSCPSQHVDLRQSP